MSGSSVTTSLQVMLMCFLLLLCGGATFNFISFCTGAHERGLHRSNGVCSSKERQALLTFKQALTDPSNRLSSWSLNQRHDCCQWSGVRCHNITGAVTQLHLRNPYPYDSYPDEYALFKLGGTISSSLLQLESLSYLDLSYNDFRGTPIPSFLGSITSLRYLNLNMASFGGLVPCQLQNLSNIRYLDLGYNYDYGIHVDNLGWITHLRSLEYLDMSAVDLGSLEVDWLQVVSMLPSLSELHLSSSSLDRMMPTVVPLGHNNNLSSSSLQVLDLSFNRLSSTIPDWLFNLSSSLRQLDLSDNSLYGEIPESLSTLRMLNSLRLSLNSLTGSIPPGIGQLKRLKQLFLGFNKLTGSIPWSIGNLTSLECLILNSNQLSGRIPQTTWLLSNLKELAFNSNPKLGGMVSEVNLSRLSKLNHLSLSSSPLLSLSVADPTWIPPFQLEILYTSFSKLGPEFPSWLRSQKSLWYLDISNSGLQEIVPDWFWELASESIVYLKLAGNKIEGDLTHVLFNSSSIDISSNCFTGQLPRLSPNVIAFSAANNTMSGPISTSICEKTNRNNNLEFLDISNNNISGQLSDCWTQWRSLIHLNLGSNNLSGKIPAEIGSLHKLGALQLSQNRLSGEIPLSLKNCTSLDFIDLGANELTGLIPSWIRERTTLLVLGLRSNKFTGSIPPQLCELSSVFILDLANNNLSGILPKCLSNFSSMANASIDPAGYSWSLRYEADYTSFLESLELVTKGTESTYEEILPLVRLIDFSNNKLSGTIPADISRLAGLHFLNLSRNHLVGEIPKKIGNMKNLESLDLSRNQLSGEIPASMSELSFLNYLDLSYNNLSGEIPLSTQLQSFSESRFLGNVGLCGVPLEKHCKDDTHQVLPPSKGDAQEESEDDMFWFYIGLGSGFACAFCGFCSTMYLNTAWRQGLFQFVEDMMNKIYVFAVVTVNRIKRRLKRRSNVSVG